MMEQNILDQLYFSKITPWESHTITPAMQTVRSRINAATETLEGMIAPEARDLLRQLLSDCSGLEALAVQESYKEGYRLGVRLTAAAFCDEKKP